MIRRRKARARVSIWILVVLLVVALAAIAVVTPSLHLGILDDRDSAEELPDRMPLIPPDTASPGYEVLEEVVVVGSRRVRPPFWNAWLESGVARVPSYDPEPNVLPGASSTLFIDLSWLSYDDVGATSTGASDRAREVFADATGDSVNLRVLLLLNGSYLQLNRGERQSKSIRVDLEKMRELLKPDAEIASTVDDPLLSLGSSSFQLLSQSQVGMTSIGVSIWANGAPVDEFNVPVCIATDEADCDFEAVEWQSLAATDSLRTGPQRQEHDPPSVAVTFIDLYDTTLVGALRCNVCSWPEHEFLTWDLGRDFSQLEDYLADTIKPSFEAAGSTKSSLAFADAGRDLYRALFGSDRNARAEFEAIVASVLELDDKPRFFARTVQLYRDDPLLVPFGLVSVPMPQGNNEFLGNLFRLETALWYQDYRPQTACIDRWSLLVPPRAIEDTSLADARGQIGSWLLTFMQNPAKVQFYEDIPAFRSWLEDWQSAAPTVTEDPPLAVMILGHHHNNQVFFDPDTRSPNITSSTIERDLPPSSVVIINACGAAGAGASDFIASFNAAGAAAVIATTTTVDAKMAGDFMNKFLEFVNAGSADDRYSIQDAVFDASQAIRPVYQDFPLIYSVYGNGQLELCVP